MESLGGLERVLPGHRVLNPVHGLGQKPLAWRISGLTSFMRDA
jgi:hypothetical protein